MPCPRLHDRNSCRRCRERLSVNPLISWGLASNLCSVLIMMEKVGARTQRALQRIRFWEFQVTINSLDGVRLDPGFGGKLRNEPICCAKGEGALRCWKRPNYETKPNSPAHKEGYRHPGNPGIGLADGGTDQHQTTNPGFDEGVLAAAS